MTVTDLGAEALENLQIVRTPRVQRDEKKVAVDGNKYVIRGRAPSGLPLETVGKIIKGEDGQEYFLISVYEAK